MTTRFLVTGSEGQLGRSLVASLQNHEGAELAAAVAHRDLDIADREALLRLMDDLGETGVDVLLNAAAYTAVDRCESEKEAAFRVNAEAPALLAEVCAARGCHMVHVSTDYVFDGESPSPYAEGSPTGPRSVYGQSKLQGEQAVLASPGETLVVRTSWVFGDGHNFVRSILKQATIRRGETEPAPLRVVNDQEGAPTYSDDLAEGILGLYGAGSRGLFHLSNAGSVSWFGFAREILDQAGYSDLAVEPLSTAELDLPAHRPRYSLLDCSRAAEVGVRLRPWQEALAAYLAVQPGEATEAAST